MDDQLLVTTSDSQHQHGLQPLNPQDCLQPPCPKNEPPLWKGYGATVLANPLRGLPPLPKYHHMSGDYNLYTFNAVCTLLYLSPQYQVHTTTIAHLDWKYLL